MTRRTCLALMYAGTSNRWVRGAVSSSDPKLSQQCVGQWKKSTSVRAHSACQRLALSLPEYPCTYQPEPHRK